MSDNEYDEIPPDNAERKYGIKAFHNRMKGNDELRFRLQHIESGTAYIRTETADTEGWQKTHYHKRVSETYIVQEGSVIFVQLKNGMYSERRLKQGAIITVDKDIAHNVYMYKNTVIHTVKHGISVKNSGGDDWWDDKYCKKLDMLIGLIDVNDIDDEQPEANCCQSNSGGPGKTEPPFTKTYMHFDKLIWKFPSWIFALLTIGIALIALFTDRNCCGLNALNAENTIFGHSLFNITGCLFILFAILGAILVYTMYRFRVNQMIERRRKNIWPLSPQILIQIFSNVLVAILALISSTLFTENIQISTYIIVIVAVLIISILGEIILRKCNDESKTSEKQDGISRGMGS